MRKTMRAHLGLTPEETKKDEDLALAKAEAAEAKAKAEVELASGKLFRAAPPGLPTLAQLDERLKAMPENKVAQKGGLSKETIALIQKAIYMNDGEEGEPAPPGHETDGVPSGGDEIIKPN